MDKFELATELHAIKCTFSHIDYCGWEYEAARDNKWEIEYSAHESYLRYAENILEELPQFSAEQIVQVLKGVKTGMNRRRF